MSMSRGRPVDPSLHARFIDAALELVAERGYRALTIAAVAARAGASTASLYRRWPNKHALVVDIAHSLTENALSDVNSGTLAQDLRILLTRKQQLLNRVGSVLLALLAESGHDGELRAILREEVLDVTERRLRVILERAVSRGEIRQPSEEFLRILAPMIVGTGLIEHALMGQVPIESAQIDQAPVERGMVDRIEIEQGMVERASGEQRPKPQPCDQDHVDHLDQINTTVEMIIRAL